MDSKWIQRFMDLAQWWAGQSKDASTGVGATVVKGKKVISQGFNGYPSGVLDRDEPREIRLKKTIHAEENALLFAKQDLEGCTIFVWPMPPCSSCAAKIIQAGIKKVYAPKPSPEHVERWGGDFEIARSMYRDAGVTLVELINV